MVNSMVERATSDMLIGPDWAMNIEICDVCNSDPMQAKDVVKGLKKRLSSKNPKVQLLALTLLETIVKNCGDIVHIHVADRAVVPEMVKIVKKKPDFHVKEKILILIDTWQEAFGGPHARYPQYFAAYQELLRIGAVFPQRSERSAPVLTPPQSQPLSSYPQNLRNPESRQEGTESSAESQFPTLSLTEIQNARGIMDVLAEMLNALDPKNKEGLKQDALVDLVDQCRTHKQRVMHLVNSTSDESLLSLGLALNDDLQRILAKHEAISSGTSVPAEKPKPEPAQSLVAVDVPLIDTGDSKPLDQGSSFSSSLGTQLALPAPPTANGSSSTPTKADTKMDLLSGDDFSSPIAENSRALVPVGGEPQPVSPVSSQQNALALVDMFPQSNNNTQSTYLVGQAYPSSPQFQQQQNLQSPQLSFYQNGNVPGATLPQYEQSVYTQGDVRNSSFPLPPWEAQPTDSSHWMGSQSVIGAHSQPSPSGPYPHMYMHPVTGVHLAAVNNQAMQGNQMGMYPQPMQPAQMAYMYQQQQMYINQMAGYSYGYGQQPNAQFLGQRMSGLSVRDDNIVGKSSYPISTPSYVPSGKPSKPQDNLFGDLVDISKFKRSSNPTPGRAGSM